MEVVINTQKKRDIKYVTIKVYSQNHKITADHHHQRQQQKLTKN